jgi:excisionase family DNA binding protein
MRKATLPRLYSPRELSELTGIPRSSWYGLIARGEVPAVRIGTAVRVAAEDAERVLASRREVAR